MANQKKKKTITRFKVTAEKQVLFVHIVCMFFLFLPMLLCYVCLCSLEKLYRISDLTCFGLVCAESSYQCP